MIAPFAPERPIRVGVIGASDEGWGRLAHLPALATLPGFEVTAVSSTRLESARRAAADFGVPAAYDDADALIGSPDVDLVVLAVRVEHHLRLLRKIARARKPVYSEWPSGMNLTETLAARNLFAAAGVRAATGLQARSTPAIRFVADLVAEGFIGRVLSSTLQGVGRPWGDIVEPRNAYLEDDAKGGTMVTIPFGHTIDALCTVLGEFTSLSAVTAVQRPIVRLEGTDRTVRKTTPDQLAMVGTVAGGAVVSAHFRGGRIAGEQLRWQIDGTGGTIVITAPVGSLQLTAPTICAATGSDPILHRLAVPDRYVRADPLLSVPAATVAEALIAFEQDLRTGSHTAPSFDDAVARKRMLDAMRIAADTGARQLLPD